MTNTYPITYRITTQRIDSQIEQQINPSVEHVDLLKTPIEFARIARIADNQRAILKENLEKNHLEITCKARSLKKT